MRKGIKKNMLGYMILFIYLLFMAGYDLKRREIQLGISAVVAVLLAVVQIYGIFQGETTWLNAFSGVVVGILLIGVSIATRGEIGIGDGITFIISGMVLGIFENGVLLFISLLFTAFTGGFLFLIKRVGRKYTMPFVPFVFVGYGVICLWNTIC